MWGALLGFAQQQANTPDPGQNWNFGDIGGGRFGGNGGFGGGNGGFGGGGGGFGGGGASGGW
jgi:uncharacterized protein